MTAGSSFPQIGGRDASWDEALDRIASAFSRSIAEHGPDAVAFYVSGQFLTEDYYVANKLMKGFIGSANIDTNSRLCMASSVAGHVRAFGEDIVPGCLRRYRRRPTLSFWSAATRRGAIRCSISASSRRARSAAPGSWSSIRAAPRPATSPISIWRCAPAPMSPCSPDCWSHLIARGACNETWTAAIHRRFRRRSGGGAENRRRRSPTSPRSPMCHQPISPSFYDLVRRHRAHGDALFARHQPILRRHRQGQRHHQLPSGDRPHRPAGHGAVLARPGSRTRWAAAKSADSPISWPRI